MQRLDPVGRVVEHLVGALDGQPALLLLQRRLLLVNLKPQPLLRIHLLQPQLLLAFAVGLDRIGPLGLAVVGEMVQPIAVYLLLRGLRRPQSRAVRHSLQLLRANHYLVLEARRHRGGPLDHKLVRVAKEGLVDVRRVRNAPAERHASRAAANGVKRCPREARTRSTARAVLGAQRQPVDTTRFPHSLKPFTSFNRNYRQQRRQEQLLRTTGLGTGTGQARVRSLFPRKDFTMPTARDDLVTALEMPQCHCLNEASDHTLRHCLSAESREDSGAFLQSDADEELVITIKFMQAVKVSAIIVQAVLDDVDSAPTSINIYKNVPGGNLDFDDAKSTKPTQEVTLSKADVMAGAPQELRFVNFQDVQTLSIFVPGNHGGGDVTKIAKIAVLGELVQQQGLKRSAEQQASATKGDWLNG